MTLKGIVKTADDLTGAAEQIIIALASLVSLIVAPLGPALTFGYSLNQYAQEFMGVNMAAMAGVALALTLESAGMLSAKVALQTYAEWRNDQAGGAKLAVALLLPAAYFILGTGAVWFFDENFRVLGILSFTMAIVVYTAHGALSESLFVQEQVLEEAESDLELKRLRLQQQHELKLRKLELTAAPAQPVAKQAPITQQAAVPDWRTVDETIRQAFYQMSKEEIEAMFPGISPRKVRDWRRFSRETYAADSKVASNGQRLST